MGNQNMGGGQAMPNSASPAGGGQKGGGAAQPGIGAGTQPAPPSPPGYPPMPGPGGMFGGFNRPQQRSLSAEEMAHMSGQNYQPASGELLQPTTTPTGGSPWDRNTGIMGGLGRMGGLGGVGIGQYKPQYDYQAQQRTAMGNQAGGGKGGGMPSQ